MFHSALKSVLMISPSNKRYQSAVTMVKKIRFLFPASLKAFLYSSRPFKKTCSKRPRKLTILGLLRSHIGMIWSLLSTINVSLQFPGVMPRLVKMISKNVVDERRCSSNISCSFLISILDPSHRMNGPRRLAQNRFAFPLTSHVGRRSNLAKRNVRYVARMQSIGPCSADLTEWAFISRD